MHTVMVLSGGFALLGLFCVIGRWRAGDAGLGRAARGFIPAWAVAALVNMAVGVVHAGYTVMQELPILIVIFALPAAAAWFLARRFPNRRAGR